MRDTFSQLTCLYQLDLVMAVSVMWGFFGLYEEFLFGSDGLAIVGCFLSGEMNSSLTARRPPTG